MGSALRAFWSILISFPLLVGGEAPTGLPGVEFIANLTAEVHQEAPLSLASGGTVSLRLINTCGGPIGIASLMPPDLHYPVNVFLPDKRPPVANEVLNPILGPTLGDQMRCVMGGVVASPMWHKDIIKANIRKLLALDLRKSRGRLALMPQEGISFFFSFRPGWMTVEDVPQARATKQLALSVPGMQFSLWIPALKGGVPMGKPIIWESETPNAVVCTNRAIAISQDPGDETAKPFTPSPDTPLYLRIEPDASLVPGEDLPITYAIGNVSAEPVWIWQNSLTPANLTWTIQQGDGQDGKKLGSVDGAMAMPLQRLLPQRPPFLLMPGEFLCWKHAIPTNGITGIRKGGKYRIIGNLPATSAPMTQSIKEPEQMPLQPPLLSGSMVVKAP